MWSELLWYHNLIWSFNCRIFKIEAIEAVLWLIKRVYFILTHPVFIFSSHQHVQQMTSQILLILIDFGRFSSETTNL